MARKPSLKNWYTCAQAAIALDCTRANIWMLIRFGRLPNAVLCGNSFMIPKGDIEARRQHLSTLGKRRGRKRKNSTAAA